MLHNPGHSAEHGTSKGHARRDYVSNKMALGRTQRGEHEEDEDDKGRRRGEKRREKGGR
jgi:hypothetical protein